MEERRKWAKQEWKLFIENLQLEEMRIQMKNEDIIGQYLKVQ